MALTQEEVDHIARLAHLALTPRERALYREQLEAILEYAARVRAVDTSAISPTTSVLLARSVTRADEPRPCLAREDTLRAAPDSERGMFRVPAVFE